MFTSTSELLIPEQPKNASHHLLCKRRGGVIVGWEQRQTKAVSVIRGPVTDIPLWEIYFLFISRTQTASFTC